MGLKNDAWIRQQCTPPTFIVEELINVGGDRAFNKVERLTWECEEEIIARMSKSRMPGNRSTVVNSFRKFTAEEVNHPWQPMISPFEASQVRYDPLDPDSNLSKCISYGTSSYGYDIRVSDEFKIFTNINTTVVDPKNFDDKCFVDVKGPKCIIPPNSFALARTVEYLKIPRNVLTICLGKSTYARCGIIVNVTPFEPEWEGYVTLEFSNTTPLPAVIYANEGCAQVLFFEGDEQCETTYKDRGGKYQGQVGVTVPRM